MLKTTKQARRQISLKKAISIWHDATAVEETLLINPILMTEFKKLLHEVMIT